MSNTKQQILAAALIAGFASASLVAPAMADNHGKAKMEEMKGEKEHAKEKGEKMEHDAKEKAEKMKEKGEEMKHDASEEGMKKGWDKKGGPKE